MVRTPASLRRIPIAIVTSLALIGGSFALGMSNASATGSTVRKFSATVTPKDCVVAGSVTRFTATVTNSTSSNQPLGSALLHSNTSNGFHNIFQSSFTTPVATGGKTWQAIPDTLDADGIYLKASSTSQALSPGQSVTVTFEAKAPSSTGNKTWITNAWQGTNFLSSSFSFASGFSNPVVTVKATCVGPAAGIAFVTGPSNTTAGGPMAPPVTVKVRDASNNGVSGQTVSLTSGGLGSSPSAVTDGSGIATFSGLVVGTVPGTYAMTATSGAFTTPSASFDITVGAPSSIEFTQQPTNTIVDGTIAPAVEVTVKDQYSNPVSGLSLGLIISPDSFAYSNNPVLTGGEAVLTGPNGVASFNGLSIDLSSSGYKLRSTVGTNIDSSEFAITSTSSDCNNCTAELPNGGTVSAPDGTTLIVEHSPVVFCEGFTGFAGTVTVIPSGSGNVELTFVDPYTDPGEPHPQVGKTYPFCKGSASNPGTGTLLTLPDDLCDATPNPPCIKSQVFITGPLDLQTVLVIDATDPPVRH